MTMSGNVWEGAGTYIKDRFAVCPRGLNSGNRGRWQLQYRCRLLPSCGRSLLRRPAVHPFLPRVPRGSCSFAMSYDHKLQPLSHDIDQRDWARLDAYAESAGSVGRHGAPRRRGRRCF
jgi:hypothetical protein